MKKKILKLLENDARLTPARLADMLGAPENAIAAEIKELEKSGVIAGYRALVDWELAEEELVTALIEVKVAPRRDIGFERVAERIHQFEEVQSLYLMSGGFDLCVIIAGRTMREVALFVAQKLSTLDGVTGTATHFILRRYKEGGVTLRKETDEQERIELI